jgi:predicted exporter
VKSLDLYLQGRWPFALRRLSTTELAEEASFAADASARAARLPAVQATLADLEKRALALGATPDDAQLQSAQRDGLSDLTRALGRAEAPAGLDLVVAEVLMPPQDAVEKPPILLAGKLTGEPLLDRAFSRAVDRNQWRSLGVALLAVLIALLFAQRALWPAVLSLLPAVMSLLVVFGTLGWVGQPIDLGTSLVGSIVTSSGADFAMHYIWYLLRRPARDVVPTVGPVIFTTAALLGLGMGVLMLGAAPPLRLFGGLACGGLLLSALFTFVLVPALLPLPKNLNTQESSS